MYKELLEVNNTKTNYLTKVVKKNWNSTSQVKIYEWSIGYEKMFNMRDLGKWKHAKVFICRTYPDLPPFCFLEPCPIFLCYSF